MTLQDMTLQDDCIRQSSEATHSPTHDSYTPEERVWNALSRLPGRMHFAWSPYGSTQLNKGEILEPGGCSLEKFRELAAMPNNVAFLPGVKATVEKKNRVGNGDVETKPLLFFDMDLKDLGEPWKTAAEAERFRKAKDLFDGALPSIKDRFGDCWLAVFSGGGLHLHLKTEAGVEVGPDYGKFYEFLCDRLEGCFQEQVIFDRGCKDSTRLARVPGSTNYKYQPPAKTRILHFDEQGDSTKQIEQYLLEFRAEAKQRERAEAEARAEKAAQEAQNRANSSKGHNPHTDRVREALTAQGIFSRFGKPYHPRERGNGQKMLFSPLRDDGRNPSFSVNDEEKVWKDFGGQGQNGDYFDLIAALAGLSARGKDFPEVMRIAEQITGIEPPKRARTTREAKPPEATFEDYRTFFKERMPEMRRCLISGDGLIPLPQGGWDDAMNQVEVLKSHATDSGYLKHTHVAFHLERHIDEMPRRLVVDIPEWDGQDRIKELAHSLKAKHLKPDHVEYFVKDWMRKVIKRAEDSRVQNRMIILMGGQGLGKDHWIRVLTSGLGHYRANFSVQQQDKDNLAMLAERLVLNVSEFDRLSNKNDAATLKDWITREDVAYRQPYKKANRTRRAVASFIGSTNETDFLRDYTGNRRFLVFDLEDISRDYGEDSPQIIAQAQHLAATEWTVNEEAEAKMAACVGAMTPENPEDEVAELFQAHLHQKVCDGALPRLQRIGDKQCLPNTEPVVVGILETLSKQFRWSVKVITTKLRQKSMTHRSKLGRYFVYMPPDEVAQD